MSHEYGYATMARKTEGESFSDIPGIGFRVVSFHNVGNQSIHESTNHVNFAAKRGSPTVEVRVLKEMTVKISV